MTKNTSLKKILTSVVVFVLLIVPTTIVFAQTPEGVFGEVIDSQTGAQGSSGNGAVGENFGAPSYTSGVFKIENPIKANNFEEFLSDILSIIVQIGVPVLVLMTIYTGFKFVSAKGNPGDLTKAKSMFINLIIGAFIVLGCFAISEALQNTVSQLGPITVPNNF